MDEPVSVFGRHARIVDLSHPLDASPSEPLAPVFEVHTHDDGAQLWEAMFGIPHTALPGGQGFAGGVWTGPTR